MKRFSQKIFKGSSLILAILLSFQVPGLRAETAPVSDPLLENLQPTTSSPAEQNPTTTQTEPTSDFLMDSPLSLATDSPEENITFASEDPALVLHQTATEFDEQLDGRMEASRTLLEGLGAELKAKYSENVVSVTILPGLYEMLNNAETKCSEAMSDLEDYLTQYQASTDETQKAELLKKIESIKNEMDPENQDTSSLSAQVGYAESEVDYWQNLSRRLVLIWDTAAEAYNQIGSIADGLSEKAALLKDEFITIREAYPGTDLEKMASDRIHGLEDIAAAIQSNVAGILSQYQTILASRDANDLERGKLPNFLAEVQKFIDADSLSGFPRELNYYERELDYFRQWTSRLTAMRETSTSAYQEVNASVGGLLEKANFLKTQFEQIGASYPGTVLETLVNERIHGLDNILTVVQKTVGNIDSQYQTIMTSSSVDDLEKTMLPAFLDLVDKMLNEETLSSYPGELNYYENEVVYMRELGEKFGPLWERAKNNYNALLEQEPVLKNLEATLLAMKTAESADLLAEVRQAMQDLENSKNEAAVLVAEILGSRDWGAIEVGMFELEKLTLPYMTDGVALKEIESLSASVEELKNQTPTPELKSADPKVRKAAEKTYRKMLRAAHAALSFTSASENRVDVWSETRPAILQSKEYIKYSETVESVRAVMAKMIEEASSLLAQINGKFSNPKQAEKLLAELRSKSESMSVYWQKTGKPALKDAVQKLLKNFRSR